MVYKESGCFTIRFTAIASDTWLAAQMHAASKPESAGQFISHLQKAAIMPRQATTSEKNLAKPSRKSNKILPGKAAQGGEKGEGRQQLIELIATAAYYRAERRGFYGGDEVQDWLEAEAEIDAMLCH